MTTAQDTTVRRFAVDREDLKPYWKSGKKGYIPLGDQQSYYLQFFRRLLAAGLSCTLLSTGTTDETFQQSGKQDSFRHILKSSACMYESLGSQFSTTTTGIKSGADTFDKSSFVMTFLTILQVTEILCSFRSKLEFLEKFLGNNLALSDAEDNTSEPMNSKVQQIYPFQHFP